MVKFIVIVLIGYSIQAATILGGSGANRFVVSQSQIQDSLVGVPGPTVSTTTGATSYATPTWAPAANALYMVAVVNSKASAPDTPTLSGMGCTWVQIATTNFNTLASPTERTTLFRSMTNATPTAGAVTADFAGATQTGCEIWTTEIWGVDTSGSNGAGCIVQSASKAANTTANPNISYSSSSQAGTNMLLWVFGNNTTRATVPTAPTGWVELYDATYSTPTVGISAVGIMSAPVSSSATATLASSSWGGIMVEIKPQLVTPTIPLPVNIYQDMSGTSGNLITATSANSSSHGSGGYWTNDPVFSNALTNFIVSTNLGQPLPGSGVVIAGTTYTDSSGGKGWKQNQTNSSAFMSYVFNSAPTKFSWGGFVYIPTTTDFFSVDLAGPTASGGGYAYFAYADFNPGLFDCETPTTPLVEVKPYANDKWLWITGYADGAANGHGIVQAFDPANSYATVGYTSASTFIGADTWEFFLIGRGDAHGSWHDTYVYYSNFIIDTTNAKFPLLPR